MNPEIDPLRLLHPPSPYQRVRHPLVPAVICACATLAISAAFYICCIKPNKPKTDEGFSLQAVLVPEPAAFSSVAALGLAGFAFCRRRRPAAQR